MKNKGQFKKNNASWNKGLTKENNKSVMEISKSRTIDITGKKYNKLTAIKFVREEIKSNGRRRYFWLFKCDCGEEKIIEKSNVTTYHQISCGCSHNEKDITGLRFGHLTAIKFSHKKGKMYYWLFRCTCGKEKLINKNGVIRKKVTSCGCLTNVKPNNESAKNEIYHRYYKDAIKRNLKFALTKKQLINIISQPCYYCGNTFSNILKTNSKNVKNYYYNGIDRKNNSIGYLIDNCVPCCKKCNITKGKMKYKEFEDWILKIANNINKRRNKK